jgi:hypothetical protein
MVVWFERVGLITVLYVHYLQLCNVSFLGAHPSELVSLLLSQFSPDSLTFLSRSSTSDPQQ